MPSQASRIPISIRITPTSSRQRKHKDFQDRVVWLREQVPESYRDNVWVSVCYPLNEPNDSRHTRLVSFYDRIEKAIRAVNPHHILWLDGNTFATDFRAFNHVPKLPLSVQHSLTSNLLMGFPTGERYKGTPEQDQKLETQYLCKTES
ncbi:unnamed protein product [Tuber aestivum]|uniref:Uncharacterized protein n=1 Tax=Tuber aestivum TaxID=59557 RepID=A0A292PY84_9PEZI|nr:unnamed protein product [Tuber aestivum]